MGEAAPVTIVIAGGGTAGWMAAAAFGHFLQRGYRIRLVESDEIGTVGVGEATIPQMLLFNRALGLDEDAFLRATGGTFKLGIEFVEWWQPGHRYMHAFGAVGRDVGLIPFQHYWLRARAAGTAQPLAAYALNEAAARAGRMHRGPPITGAALPAMPYAYHFDAGRYAAYLRRFATARGVERIQGRIAAVERAPDGDAVRTLVLASGERIDGDLFIDCTGFHARLIGDALGVGYEDWSHWLPCDRALAVASETALALEPFTRSTAKDAGWQWRIPLQHRTGNGLVYSSAFLDDERAADTLLAGLDTAPLASPRALRFATGRRREAWRGNVVAIGLAAGFLEPLESTSIFLIQSAIGRLLKFLPGRTVAPADRAEYNRQTDFEIERIRDFIILHYRASRREAPFWRAVRATPPPDTLAAKVDLYRSRGIITREHEELFTEVGWLQVFAGQGIEPAGYHPLADQIDAGELAEFMTTIETLYRREAERMTPHHAFVAQHCAAPAS